MILNLIKWCGVIALVAACAWLSNWNEYDSPWGQEYQAHKLQTLKKKLCD